MHQKEEVNSYSSSGSESMNDKEIYSAEGGRGSFQHNSPYSTRPSSLNTLQTNTYNINERKMSSPICVYYHSSQKFLSQLFEQKSKEQGYDLYKSGNYIEKDSLFNGGNFGENYDNTVNKYCQPGRNSYPSPTFEENNQMSGLYCSNSRTMFTPNEDNLDYKMNYFDEFNSNNNFYNFNMNSSNNYLEMEREYFVYQQPQSVKPINNVNAIPQTPAPPNLDIQNYNNMMNSNNAAAQAAKLKQKKMPPMMKERRKPKAFVEREGDWICSSCKNLNFAFRKVCNRCATQKNDNDVIIKLSKIRNKNGPNLDNEYDD